MKRFPAQIIGDTTLYTGDCLQVLKRLPAGSARTCVTSPPYFALRDYGEDQQIGLEESPGAYVKRLVRVFRQVRRVLASDGSLWLNLGDSYAGAARRDEGFNHRWHGKHFTSNKQGQTDSVRPKRPLLKGLRAKNLIGIPWKVAFALQADGWILRADIIWHKSNPMPESVSDRPTKAHEYIFLLSKSEKYFYDAENIKEDAVNNGKEHGRYSFKRPRSARGSILTPYSNSGTHRPDREDIKYCGPLRNRRSVWSVSVKPFGEAHFATYPVDLVEPCILAGSVSGDVVLDPFMGSGTTGVAAKLHNRRFIGIDLKPSYVDMAARRISNTMVQEPLFPATTMGGAL